MIDYGVHDCDPWADDCRECSDCEEKEQTMDGVRDDLKDLISVLYKGGQLDLGHVDRCIEQLCHRTGMPCPIEELEDIHAVKEMTA